jgi:hypothetical protein
MKRCSLSSVQCARIWLRAHLNQKRSATTTNFLRTGCRKTVGKDNTGPGTTLGFGDDVRCEG